MGRTQDRVLAVPRCNFYGQLRRRNPYETRIQNRIERQLGRDKTAVFQAS